jgi:DNA-binding MarR family transcriptional regulator
MIHPTSVTNIVDRLEAQHLVRRVDHPTDRRTTLCEITDEGRRLVTKATEAVSAVDLGIAGLSEREVDQLTRLLTKLRRASGDFET